MKMSETLKDMTVGNAPQAELARQAEARGC